MSTEELRPGDRRRITVDATYRGDTFRGCWIGDAAAISVSSAAIVSVEPIPEPPYTPEVGDWFQDGDGALRLCIADGWAACLQQGSRVFATESLRVPFTKVPAP